jgi:hypothetical protein
MLGNDLREVRSDLWGKWKTLQLRYPPQKSFVSFFRHTSTVKDGLIDLSEQIFRMSDYLMKNDAFKSQEKYPDILQSFLHKWNDAYLKTTRDMILHRFRSTSPDNRNRLYGLYTRVLIRDISVNLSLLVDKYSLNDKVDDPDNEFYLLLGLSLYDALDVLKNLNKNRFRDASKRPFLDEFVPRVETLLDFTKDLL